MILACRRTACRFLVLFILCSPLLGALPAAAADLFTVTGVPVDATAESATAARSRALIEGQRTALRELLQRLTLKRDWPRLPSASENQLNGLVQGFEIADERTSPTRYIAKLTVAFRRDGVRDLLNGTDVPFTEATARPIVVLPVWRTAEGAQLWEPNPWLAAWTEAARAGALVPFVVPSGDSAIRPEQAIAGEPDALADLTRRFGASEVLVAQALPNPDGVQLRLDRHSGPVPRTQFDNLSGEPTPEALASVIAGVRERVEEDWKQQTVLRSTDRSSMAAEVAFQSFAEWQAVRRKLAETPGVRQVEVSSLTHRKAQIVLQYLGDPQRLALTLAQRDLALEERDGRWTLRLDGAPGGAAASRQ